MNSVAEVTHRARGELSVNDVFLKTLRDTGNVSASCRMAGISRTEAYRRKERDAEFSELWDIAVEISVDKLEFVARNRAIQGTKKPIYYKGELVDYVYEPSDRLMELLLKAHRPDKFNPVQKTDVSGNINITVAQFDVAEGKVIEGQVIENPGNKAAQLPDQRGGVSSSGGTPKVESNSEDDPCDIADF